MNSANKSSTASRIAAYLCALSFVVGFVMIFYIAPGINLNPHQRLAFILSNGRYFQLWYSIIFVLFGVSLLVLVNGINKLISRRQTLTYYLSMMFGFVWGCYAIICGLIAILSIEYLLMLPTQEQSSVWFALYSIQVGLGDGVEWVGGCWLFTLSLHGLRHKLSQPAIHYYGLIVGLMGCITLIPGFGEAGALFGLGQIAWFAIVGAHLFENASKVTHSKEIPLPNNG